MRYRPNPKHKPGCQGGGPPRWFPSNATLCPDDVTAEDAATLLSASVAGAAIAHPYDTARYAIDEEGRIYKAYSEDHGETWHGYPVAESAVKVEVPTKVLRVFLRERKLTTARYNKLLGSA